MQKLFTREATRASGGGVVVEFAEILCVRGSWSGGGGVVVEFAEIFYVSEAPWPSGGRVVVEFADIIYAGGYNS